MNTPSMSVFIISMSVKISNACTVNLVYDLKQVLSVLIFQHRSGDFLHLLTRNPALAISNAFEASNFKPLAFFKDLNVNRCLRERIMSTGVKPCESSRERLYSEFSVFEKCLIYRGYFQFTPCGWLNLRCHIHNFIGVKV